jgi:hypothetical protein
MPDDLLAYTSDRDWIIRALRKQGYSDRKIVIEIIRGRGYTERKSLAKIWHPLLGITYAEFMRLARG